MDDIKGYSLVECLGSGSFATAYRVSREGAEYCLRELQFGRTNGNDSAFKSWELFEREAEVLQLLDHPRIPQVHDYFTVEDNGVFAYMVQDLIPGKNLKDLVAERGPFSEDEALDIVLQLCDILEYVHSEKVIHRDIKPSNIHLDGDEVYLLDFGALQQGLTKVNGGSTTFGTPGFAPIEVPAGFATAQSDLYMLGSTLVNLVSGIDPSEMVGFDQLGRPMLAYQDQYEFGNKSLQFVVDKLLQFNPQDRLQSAEEVADYLQKVKAGFVFSEDKVEPGLVSRLIAWFVDGKVLRYIANTRGGELDVARSNVRMLPGPRLVEANRESIIKDLIDNERVYKNLVIKGIPGALRKAYADLGEDGVIAGSPLLIAGRAEADKSNYLWQNFFSCFSGLYSGIDVKGEHVSKGDKVAIFIHNGCLFTNPDRVEQALNDGLNNLYAGKLTDKEWNDLIRGQLPGKSIELYTIDEVRQGRNPNPLFGNYGIVVPMSEAERCPSGRLEKKDFLASHLSLAFAGTPEYLEPYFDKAKYEGKSYLWHPFTKKNKVVLSHPQGRLLCLGSTSNGLYGNYRLDYNARFAGVSGKR